MPEVTEVVQKWVVVPSAVGNSNGLWIRRHSEADTFEISAAGKHPVVINLDQMRHGLDVAEHQK